MLDFAGKRWYYLSISIVLVVIAGAALAIWQLKPGIEFTSGSQFTVEFTERSVSQGEVRQAMSELDHPEARVQGAGTNRYLIRTSELENAPPISGGEGPAVEGEIDTIMAGLQDRFGAVSREDFSTVSGTVSSEIVRNATFAVLAASVMILLYIWWAFRELDRPIRYGVCAIIAIVHDALIVLGLFAILGRFNGVEVDVAFLTAILTVIGFSVHDTIVVFDRMREIMKHDAYIPFNEAVNSAMTDTLARSINTSLVVIFTTLAMLLLGGETIRYFLLALLVGIVVGTYSSIGVSVQVLTAWENGDFGKLWRRIRGQGKSDDDLAPDPA